MDRIKLLCEEMELRKYADKISCGCLLTNERTRQIILDLFVYVDGTKELRKLFQEAHAKFMMVSDRNGKAMGWDYTLIDGVERNSLQTIEFFRNIYIKI